MGPTVHGLNLTKQFQLGDENVKSLDDVTLEIYPGEMIAIVGESGSGKSTLLHILGCLLRPDSGQVFIQDQNMTQLDDAELARVLVDKIGFVFEAYNLVPSGTALENVELALLHQGLKPSDRYRQALKALQVVGLENRLDRTPNQLSPRQRRSVAIARALVHNPLVIFADEPARGLDSTSRDEILGLLQKLNDEGMTIVFTTSDSGVAGHCRREIRLDGGKTVHDKLLSRRRTIPPSRIPRTPAESHVSEDETICPRCNHGNPGEKEFCQRCECRLKLTVEEEEAIKSRLSYAESRWLGVESASEDGEVPGQVLTEELKAVQFFNGLGSKSLVKLIPALEQRHFSTGSTIVKQGDEGDSFYIIRNGEVEVLVEGATGSAVSVARMGPKQGFGEMSLLNDEPRSASVVTLSDVDVWRLPKEPFNELLFENPSLAIYFNRLLAERLSALNKQVDPSIELL